ncbi:DNA-binding protein [Corallococcus sp. H22C18031201]|nr:DNA-binding protein [Corallococcus sp. H22C18031201]
MAVGWKSNVDIADTLERVADLLETQDAMPFRVTAYRNAARSVAQWPTSVADLLATDGEAGLRQLPGVGKSIAAAIAEWVHTGHLALLQRLEAEVSPEALLASVPGLGPELAHRIHDTLGVSTLEELELAAHDGRLERVEGFGPRRAEQVRELLVARLSRSRRAGDLGPVESPAPDVALLLHVDQEYRQRAEAGTLRRIAPRRFNPSGEAWLPVFSRTVEGWAMRALFSNTALAHQQGTTHDWVVLYYDRDGEGGQCTVVTARSGPMEGLRVVRGRETECLAYYGRGPEVPSPAAH